MAGVIGQCDCTVPAAYVRVRRWRLRSCQYQMSSDVEVARPALALLRLLHQRYAQEVDAALQEAGFHDIRAWHANVFAFARSDGIQVSELAALSQVR